MLASPLHLDLFMKALTLFAVLSFLPTLAVAAGPAAQAPNARGAVKALYGRVPYPIWRMAKRIDAQGAKLNVIGVGETALHAATLKGAQRAIELSFEPTATVRGNGSVMRWRQSTSFEGIGKRGRPALIQEQVFLVGKRASKLLREAGLTPKKGQEVTYTTTFLLDGSKEVRRKAFYVENGQPVSAPLPVTGEMKRMAEKLSTK